MLRFQPARLVLVEVGTNPWDWEEPTWDLQRGGEFTVEPEGAEVLVGDYCRVQLSGGQGSLGYQ